ncbi:MAG TPA: PKD domain-containing protein, partial [Acidimicrobiales bacterium]|nr:PKD domain-containing protein [Acidimicrobiales bacterium]
GGGGGGGAGGFFTSGGRGGNGGSGGTGGVGGAGGLGGTGGKGGAGGGAMEILTRGRIVIENTQFNARGGTGAFDFVSQGGSSGSAGTAGTAGSAGAFGQSGGGAGAGAGGRGGAGATGGSGGGGGFGGLGGLGGGGAGGTIKLSGSVVTTDNARIDASGGVGGFGGLFGNNGATGRFVLASNAGSFEFFDLATLQDLVLANEQFFTGPTELNPFIEGPGTTSTPLLPGLKGGAAAYGVLEIGAAALLGSQVFDAAPEGAPLALIRVDGGIPGLMEAFGGYDLLLLANLTDQAVLSPRLVVGDLEQPVALLQGGFLTLTQFGGDGAPDVLTALEAGGVYALLIPEATAFFTVTAQQNSVNFLASVESLEDGQVLFVRPPGLTVDVDQTLAPAGESFGGRPWQSLGVITVGPDAPDIEVLVKEATAGLAAVDAVRLVRVDTVLPSLKLLTLNGNPLNDRAHELFVPALQSGGVTVATDADSAPQITQITQQGDTTTALDLNGVNDFVEIAHSETLDIARELTLEVTFRVDAFGNTWMPLVQKSDGTGTAHRAFSLWVNAAGFLHFTSADGSFQDSVNTPNGSIQPGKWYHFAGVMDRDTGRLDAYLNGELVASGFVRPTDAFLTSKPLLIGQTFETSAGFSPFNGAIDEVRLWDSARSQPDIRRDMAKVLTGAEAGLAGLWRFNEISGFKVLDASPNANHGQLGGTAPAGLSGPAATFDGINDFILSPNLASSFTGDSLTLELWFNPKGAGVLVAELSVPALNIGFHNSLIEVLANGQVRIRVANVAPITLGTVDFNNWHHVVLRYDGASNRLDGFLDGVKSTVAALGDRLAAFEASPGFQLYALGATDFNHLGSGAFFRGRMSDFRMWDHARSDADILAGMNGRLTGAEGGLVNYWRLDDLTPAGAPDSSGRNLPGAPVNGVQAGAEAPDRFRGPLHIDAADLDLDRLTLTAESSDPDVAVSIQGNQLFITPSGVGGTARITVFAADATGTPGDHRGRRDVMSFDFTWDPVAIYGSKWNDLDFDGVRDPGEPVVEGVQLFVDFDNDGTLDAGEPVAYTDANGDYAFRDLPFVPATPLLPPVLVSNEAFPADGGAVETVVVAPATLDVVDRADAEFALIVRTDDGAFHTATIAITPAMTADNLTLADLAGDLNAQFAAAGLANVLLAGVDGQGTRLTLEVLDQPGVASPVNESLTVFAQTGFLFTEHVTFGDGSVRELVSETLLDFRALGFADGQSAAAPDVLLAASLTTNASGGLHDFSFTEAGEDRVVTRSELTLRLRVDDEVQKVLLLTPEMTQDNVTPADLVGDLNALLAAAGLEDRVVAQLQGDRIRLAGTTAGADRSLELAVSTRTTTQRVVEFFGDTFISEQLLDATVASGLGFGGLQLASGADRSYGVAEVPFPGWASTTNPTAGGGGTVGLRPVAFQVEGQIVEGVDFGNVRIADFDLGADFDVNEGEAVQFAPVVTALPDAVLTYLWEVETDNGQVIADGTEASFGFVPLDNGIYTVRLTVTDTFRSLTAHPDAVMVTAHNVAPAVDAGMDRATIEGQMVELSGALFTDPGALDTHAVTILWGDSTSSAGTIMALAGGGFAIAGSHVYADDGNYVVTVRVTDDDGGAGEDTLAITVDNAAPVVDAGLDRLTTEGAIVELTVPGSAAVAFTDAGTADTHAVTVDWGDGTGLQNGSAGEIPFGPPGSITGMAGFALGSHVYADNGVYTVTVTVSDDEGASHSDSFLVTVENVAPEILASGPRSGVEGQVFALTGIEFRDLGTSDTHTGTVSWGDGTAIESLVIEEVPFGPPGAATGLIGTLHGSHVYADDGDYEVTFTLTDDDGAVATQVLILSVLINNADPVVDAGAGGVILEGETFSLSGATFTDPGTADTHTASVDWGEGSTSGGIVTESPFGPPGSVAGMGGTVAASHAYLDNGVFQAGLTVTDDDGGTGTDGAQVTVLNVAPTVSAGADQFVEEGSFATIVASFADPGLLDTHTAIINWGDGAMSPGVIDPLTRTVTGSHLYGARGAYLAEIVVTDDDGGAGTDALIVTVGNAPPVVTAGGATLAQEGVSFALPHTFFTDNSAVDTHTATVDFGDGTVVAGAIDAGTGVVSASHVYGDNGVFEILVTVTDSEGASGTGTWLVTVENVAPLALGDAYFVDEDEMLQVAAPGVLGNDTDVPADTLHAMLVAGPEHGTLILNADGSFSYQPHANFNGEDGFSYQAADEDGGISTVALVQLTVAPVNDPPQAVPDTNATDPVVEAGVAPGDPVATGNVLANDVDPDTGDSLTVTAINGNTDAFDDPVLGVYGTLFLTPEGNWFYTLNNADPDTDALARDATAMDVFGYTAQDAAGASSSSTLAIFITGANDAPVSVADAYVLNEDTPLAVTGPGVLENDEDVDGDALNAILLIGPAHGSLTLQADGSFSYVPDVNFSGSDSFVYKANDGLADSAAALVTLTVNSVNDAPVADDDAYGVEEDAVLTVGAALGVLNGDADPNDTPPNSLLATLVDDVDHGILVLNAD